MINKQTEAALINLLWDIEQIENIHRDTLSKGFNIFEAAGLVRQEIRHSNILAFLLNPNEPHGLGDTLLKQIVNFACRKSNHDQNPNSLNMALGDFDDAYVRREEMHIDVLAWSPNNRVVLTIENKVDAGQGDGQLKDYRDKILNDSRFKGYRKLFVYLTLDEDEPEDSEWWVRLNYSDVIKILDDALGRNGRVLNEDANLFVKHYIDLIRRHVMDEVNPELKEACMRLYVKHKQVFKIIFDNIKTPITEEVKLFLESKSEEIEKLYSTNSRLAFLPKDLLAVIPETSGTDWFGGYKRPIVFWFAFNDDKIGLVVEVGPMEDTVLRGQLVSALYKAIEGKTKQARSDTFNRVWTRYEKTVVDELVTGKIKEIMDSLFKELEEEGVIRKLIDVARDIWPQNSQYRNRIDKN